MNDIKKLIELFESESHTSTDGINYYFDGELCAHTEEFEIFESQRKFELPDELVEFLKIFSGTRLFITEESTGLDILTFAEIEIFNRELEKSTDSFYPNYVFFAIDAQDDFLGIENGKHFGLLDHNDFGEVDIWKNDGFQKYPFVKWLENFITTNGDTIY